ncbi:MAG: hypothetical protein LBN96_03095 [Desulfovibrio sp.]|jgi:hypothetical protein|nr:hypothetical protein [Desulfovibrio sp.]
MQTILTLQRLTIAQGHGWKKFLEHFAFETLPSALYGETRFRLRLMGGRRGIRPAASDNLKTKLLQGARPRNAHCLRPNT